MKTNTTYSREQQIIRTSLIGIGSNVMLAAFKASVGLLANSITIILDAFNNLSDALSSIITIIGMKLAVKPADKKHPFGYGRVEYLSSIIIAGIVLFAGVSFIVESLKKIVHPQIADYSPVMLIIIGVAIMVKLLLGYYVKNVGKKTNSDSLIASGTDATFDAIISTSTLVAAVITMLWGISLDGWLGAVISIVIIKAGFEMLLGTINQILGLRANSDLSRNVKVEIISFDGVQGAYDLILHNYGPELMLGSVHIEVNDYLTAMEVCKLTREIRKSIQSHYGIILTIGIYAVNTQNDESNELQSSIQKKLTEHKEVIQMHAFYVDLEKHVISFDMIVDFEVEDTEHYREMIWKELKEKYSEYEFEIIVDKDYSD